MKTDLNSIKQELRKLTDLGALKTELGKISFDIRKFDINAHLSPQAKSRLQSLEKRFNDLSKRIKKLQKQVDGEVNKLVQALRSSTPGFAKRSATTKKSAGKKTAKKKSVGKKTAAPSGTKKSAGKTTSRKKAATLS